MTRSVLGRRTDGFRSRLATADLDGDGHLDLILGTARAQEGFVEVHLGDGEGNSEPAGEIPFGSLLIPEDIEIADLDGDDRQDLMVLLVTGVTRAEEVKIRGGCDSIAEALDV